jgi:hypothetical protein
MKVVKGVNEGEPKGFKDPDELPDDEDWKKMSRRERRLQKVKFPTGKTMNVYDYINKVAKTMPEAKTKDKGQRINHVRQMQHWLHLKGVAGINAYMQMIADMTGQLIAEAATGGKEEEHRD